jgi:hypothetical protein
MSRYVRHVRYWRLQQFISHLKYFLLVCGILSCTIYALLEIKSYNDYQQAHEFHRYQSNHLCSPSVLSMSNKSKTILFWTKIFSDTIDSDGLNGFLRYNCHINRCEITIDRTRLCQSDAVVFHARGGIRMNDMPLKRSIHQRYVLLSKEPPYKTTAIVGHLNHFFNWTATVRIYIVFCIIAVV